MGLFDFFKRKPAPPRSKSGAGPSLHYVLAHYALRQTALADPVIYLGILASEDAPKFIGNMIDAVASDFGQSPAFHADAITVHPLRVGRYPCAVIEMPEPGDVAEAYFTALVGMIDLADGPPPESEDLPARYFTLEKGATLDGQPRTVLAEWDATSHMNYGDGPIATVEAFLQAIEEHLGEENAS